MHTTRLSRRRALAALGATASPWLWAQSAMQGRPIDTQGRPITWLVGQPAGGTTDVLTRVVARALAHQLDQAVIVENRPGAAGAIALQAAAKAAQDGLTLVSIPGPTLTHIPRPQIGKEMTALAILARGPMVLVGTMATALPPTLEGLLAAARKNPGVLSYATSGNGTSQHLTGELLNQLARTQMTHIPYKGGGQAVTDVVGGQVPLGLLGITPVLPHIKAGRLRAYGISTATRSGLLPDVPTLQEAGLPDFNADQWFVVATPTGVPDDRVQALNAAINRALQAPEVQAAYVAAGVEPTLATAQQSTAFVLQEMERWQALAHQAKLQWD
ncbi:Bug family tripartite tricarboxylate transporter substrate binding protein [Verminephrobacter eiseniae]|uniref:Bug family tripartite tricarboxylate transporter substrate binding protein n=1 Tax=Verminephrobacter eiseniae TaxID=364317 RepID=UPI0010E9673A|nr:tripartite tricarboxylate transporter substrate-binding protein [Verminephrobacter eiseniae]KAB7619430.1 tripartite tricarboxylate transporter substrate binding protein [Verminephrobacter sp. Larva24]MCW5294573.1 tripartite tricarboxylate transporter substrate binding protein [Verminephrobacter eiseniae]MCW8184868.1 tripartite tricarboxylate transporter substrate binding protein [Verminephrobacter eiseniae]MCW8223614.1 tripartite tricarboxylate transporter substrate binding protein [Verminep